jgi:hypothetical protein
MKVNSIELTSGNILISIVILFLIILVTVIITKSISKCECPNLQKYDNKFATNVE